MDPLRTDQCVPFGDLADTDLHVDTVYLGGTVGTAADDALARLLPVGNQGGFRPSGSPKSGTVLLSALYTTGTDIDWPDELDLQTGIFTYYGDNKKPGQDLHQTSRSGNLLLKETFAATHGSPDDRMRVAPFFLFERAGPGRSVRFRGLLAPGAESLVPDDELAAIWRSKAGQRFQNYRARFTVLDVAAVRRTWISDILAGTPAAEALDCPSAWREWVQGRAYKPLIAPSTTVIRSQKDQMPSDGAGLEILRSIYQHFHGRDTAFEPCAVAIWKLFAPATGQAAVTRPSRDGGRDAVGTYLLGPPADRIAVDFALEAKCYKETHGVGVRDTSRLISRLKHRDFGVFVTLSYFNPQAYTEVREDGHPLVMICGRDIVDALRRHGYTDQAAVQAWLDSQFPDADTEPA
jgi:Restriction endonuclease AspBHI N-terminal/Restriction endonuclease